MKYISRASHNFILSRVNNSIYYLFRIIKLLSSFFFFHSRGNLEESFYRAHSRLSNAQMKAIFLCLDVSDTRIIYLLLFSQK